MMPRPPRTLWTALPSGPRTGSWTGGPPSWTGNGISSRASGMRRALPLPAATSHNPPPHPHHGSSMPACAGAVAFSISSFTDQNFVFMP